MPFDGLCTYAITKELQHTLVGKKISKIYQPVKDELVLYFSDREKSVLLLCANPSFPRVHLIDEKYDFPDHPPTFCMVLRKYLLGGIVTDISQKDFDRIIEIKIETLDQGGDLLNLTLIAEIMGKHSNIILISNTNSEIIDAIKHVSTLKSSVREVMPKKKYSYPPNQKINPFVFDIYETAERLSFYREKSMKNALVNVFSGISNQLSASILINNQFDPSETLDTATQEDMLCITEKVQDFFKTIDTKESYIYTDPTGKYKDFSYGFYSLYNGYDSMIFQSINKTAEKFYLSKSVSNHIRQKYESTIKLLTLLLAKEENKLLIRKSELEKAEDYEQYNIKGNLLLSNMHLLKKGMDHITVNNFFDPNGIALKISLRTDYDPSMNAQMYFKKYTKAKNAIKYLTKLIKESEEQIYYLSSQLYYLSNAQNQSDADEIIEELTQRNIIKKKKKRSKQTVESHPYHYKTNDGFDIFIGKNDKQNDRLTLRYAGKEDIWFHTKDIPGSHVILKTNHGTYSDESLMTAAKLAAYYSKARSSSNVPVDYTSVKYVKKPSGSPLGKVIYTDNNTIYVTPNENIFSEIRSV